MDREVEVLGIILSHIWKRKHLYKDFNTGLTRFLVAFGAFIEI